MPISKAMVAALFLTGYQQSVPQPVAFDYSKVDRNILSQPSYVAAPKYALLLVGPKDKTRIWMAMDKSSADAPHYDVLYLDRDGDGRLGEEGEKFSETERRSDCVVIVPGYIHIEGSSFGLKWFRLHNYFGRKVPFIWVSMRLNDEVSLSADDLQFADSPEKAPILHANPGGSLSFFRVGPEEMKIGDAPMVWLNVGIRSPGAFMAVDESFLKLEQDKLFVSVIAKDVNGRETRRRSQLKEHC